MTRNRILDGVARIGAMMEPVETKNWEPTDADAPTQAERTRLEHLHGLGILDTPRERLFQSFVEHALTIIPQTTVAAVSLVDADRQWFKAIVGSSLEETSRALSFCSHTIQTNGALVVPDARQDPRFSQNDLVVGPPGIRFYAGIKLTRAVGALCIDVTKAGIERLYQLAQFVDVQLLARGTLNNLGVNWTGKTKSDLPPNGRV